MRKGGSKAKGSAFERSVCTALSLWVTGGAKRDCFWRSSISGGRATVAKKRGSVLNRQAGDICSISPEGHSLTDRYYIDCKAYRNIQLESFLFKGIGNLDKFWRVTCAEARSYKLKPMLIAKQNNFPVIVVMEVGEFGTTTIAPFVTFNHIIQTLDCEIFLFEDLLKTKYDKRRS